MKNMRFVIYAAVALCLVSRGIVSELRASDAGKTNITVEVLIFSGRPNPTWQLQDTNSLAMLKAKMSERPAVTGKEPDGWSRLGFAGFRIHGGESLGLPGEIRIYQEIIKTGEGKGAKYLKDSNGLERRLIAEAKKQALMPPVKEAIAIYESARKAGQ